MTFETTPPRIWKGAMFAAGLNLFNVNPAASRDCTVPASCKFHGTEKDDGLKLSWFGNVWLRCPKTNREEWIEKFLKETKATHRVLSTMTLCVEQESSEEWWQEAIQSCHVWATTGKSNLNVLFWDFRKDFKDDAMFHEKNLTRWEKVHRHIDCLTFRYRHEL